MQFSFLEVYMGFMILTSEQSDSSHLKSRVTKDIELSVEVQPDLPNVLVDVVLSITVVRWQDRNIEADGRHTLWKMDSDETVFIDPSGHLGCR